MQGVNQWTKKGTTKTGTKSVWACIFLRLQSAQITDTVSTHTAELLKTNQRIQLK